MRSKAVLVLVLLLLGSAGCQRLNVNRSVEVGTGDIKEVIVDGPRSEQKIKVNLTATAPVDVYVVLSANAEDVKKKLEVEKAPDSTKVLASERKTQSATLEANIPARSEFRVILSGARKSANVDLKITG